jgi:hypothetical protein
MKKIICSILVALLCVPAFAQSAPTNYTYVYGTHLEDASGNPLNGTITFQATNAGGQPMSFRVGGGGQAILRAIQANVINGAFNVNLADVSLASPSYFCYQVTAVDNNTGNTVMGGSDYSCIQPSGASYDFDTYSTSSTPILPPAGYAVSGNFAASGNLAVTGALTAGSWNVGILSATYTNGVANALEFSGSDIGAQVNAAFSACQSEQGTAAGCTVYVPNGAYSYSTTITIPAAGTHNTLQMDNTANLTYTGSGNAIYVAASGQGVTITGGHLLGTSAATGGIVLAGSMQNTHILQVWVSGFSTADGILDLGSNTVTIERCQITTNLNGIHLIGKPGYASNAVHIEHNNIAFNLQWGIIDGDITHFLSPAGTTSPELNNVIRANVIENNGTSSTAACTPYSNEATCYGGIREVLTVGTFISGNYFEAQPRDIQLGDLGRAIPTHLQALYNANPNSTTSGGTPYGTLIEGNYYTSGAYDFVELRYAGAPSILANAMEGNQGTLTAGVWNNNGSVCQVDISNVTVNPSVDRNYSAAYEFCQSGAQGWPTGLLASNAQNLYSPAGAIGLGAPVTGTQALATFSTSSVTVSNVDAYGDYVTGTGLFKTGTASNTDAAGKLTLSSGSATYTFTGSYASAPVCTASDTTGANAVKVTTTTTALTLTGTGSDALNYECMARN